MKIDYGEEACQSLAGSTLDECMTELIFKAVIDNTEKVQAEIHWYGGHITQLWLDRPLVGGVLCVVADASAPWVTGWPSTSIVRSHPAKKPLEFP